MESIKEWLIILSLSYLRIKTIKCILERKCVFPLSKLNNVVQLYPKVNGFDFDNDNLACPHVYALWTRGKMLS